MAHELIRPIFSRAFCASLVEAGLNCTLRVSLNVSISSQGALEATLDAAREVYAPKCLCLLSTWPYFGPFREWFLNLYRISLSPFQVNPSNARNLISFRQYKCILIVSTRLMPRGFGYSSSQMVCRCSCSVVPLSGTPCRVVQMCGCCSAIEAVL